MNDNKKIAFNTLVIYVRLCFVSLISIILSRVVLDALGNSDFGLYNVVGGIVVLLNVVNSAMMSTTYRYLAFEIGKKENGNPNKVFSTSFVIHLLFALFLLLFGILIGDWYIDNYLNVLPEKIEDAHFVLHISVLTAAISTVFVPFQGLQVAYEKFAINASIDIISQSIKLAAILMFIYGDGNKLRIYSLIMMSYTALSCIIYMMYGFRYYSNVIKIYICKDWKLASEMLSYAFWTIFGALGTVGKSQGSAIVLNYFFGTIVNAAYAIACQVEGFILVFSRSLNTATVPQITKNYSGGNMERVISLTSYISKYTFILMALISFPVMLEMNWLLSLWLRDVPEGAATFCRLIVLGNLIACLGEGISNLVYASGKIKAYQVIIHTIMILGLPISFLCYKIGCNAYAICVVYCIINLVISFTRIYLLRRIVDFDIISFMKYSHIRIAYISMPMIAYYFVYVRYFPCTSIWSHILGVIISIIFYACVVFLFGLNQEEKCKAKLGLVKLSAKIINKNT